MDDGEAQEQRKQFLKELEDASKDSEALLELGKRCFLSERYNDAIEAYQKALSIEEANDTTYYNLGVACQALGKYKKAKEAYLRALELDPNHEAAQEALNGLTDY